MSKNKTRKIMVGVLTMRGHSSNLEFSALKIRTSNVRLAWEKAKAKQGLKNKIKMPKIEAYAIVDKDYERIHDSIPDESISFTRLYWRQSITKPNDAMIFIRASIFEMDKKQFYNALECECEKLLKLCTCHDLITEKNGLTPEEHMKELERLTRENPKQDLLYTLTADGKMHRVLAIPETRI